MGGAAGAGPVVLGVDSSTQSTKVEARSVGDGTVLAVGRARHPPVSPPTSEQDPAAWWAALVTAVGQVADAVPRLVERVVAVSVAAQQHGLVVADARGHPLRPAVLWNDTTSAPQAERLVARLGAEVWADACGSVPVAAFTVTKLARLAEEEPGVLAATRMLMLPHDWLTFRLCGRHVTDRGDASGTGWYQPATDRYRPDLLAEAIGGGAAAPELPEVLGPAEAAGTLTAAAAAELGLGEHVVVGPGTGDNMGAAVGLGLDPGDVVVSLGTSGTVYTRSTVPTADPTGAVAGFADATGAYLPLVCTLNATRVTDTVAGWLGTDPVGLAELALRARPRPDGPRLVPYFDGERTPDLPEATGTLEGLRNDTTREDLALAAHDGVLRGLLHGLDALSAAGADTSGAVHLVGGGARSAAYRQRLADLLGAAVRVPAAEEAVATGAAVQAAVVADAGSFEEVATRWDLARAQVVEPRPDTGA